MKHFLFTILIGTFFSDLNGQIVFSNDDCKLTFEKRNNATNLICSDSTISIKFELKHNVIPTGENNFVMVDSQVIQVIPIKFDGYKYDAPNLDTNNQKKLLDIYSRYELNYFKTDLNVEVINPNSQWVVTNSKRGWFVWYFRVGEIPLQVDKRIRIQLLASTVISNKIITVNAPIQSDEDFTKAGLIVNEMMETLTITKQ
ncbi:MAG TPA: hypothetical protein VG890_11960 [Puia sp.]|nr:hypothetical protein [Puia sp.]